MKRRNKSSASPRPPARDAALERFKPLLDEAEFGRLLEALGRPLSPSLRMNPLKNRPDAVRDLAARYAWKVEQVPYCPEGWWVHEAGAPISQTIEHHLGRYYIQDAASMLPPELFDMDLAEPPLVLDMAASPGGKTTHLVSRTGDRGLVIANDSSRSRITALRLVLQTWGAVGTAVTCFPGERFGDWFPETFDRVLLDAPCSMQGLRASESHPMRPVTDRERDNLAVRQARLLESAFRALKVGGEVVYSTCTLTPEENEGVLEQLLQRFAGAVEIIDLSKRLPKPAPALASVGNHSFPSQIRGAARLWPHLFGTAGFFSALMVKTGPVPSHHSQPPDRPWGMTGLVGLQRGERVQLSRMLSDGYGFNLEEVLDQNGWELFRRAGLYLALSCRQAREFASLPFITAGLPLGEDTPTGFALSHEWASRFEKDCPAGRFAIPDEKLPAWLRGEDLRGFSAPTGLPGRIILIVDERGNFIGRGRALADRVKNLLPARLVV